MSKNLQQTINNWLTRSTKLLDSKGITTSRLDCLVILEDVLAKDRSWLLANPDLLIQEQFLDKLDSQVERRAMHEPLAYIRGFSEFYGRKFIVSKDTLEPRPETETMIDLLHSHFPSLLQDSLVTDGGNVNATFVDVGTGSGCIAITVKLALPESEVIGVDISEKCIKIAKSNATDLKAKVKFYQGNLLEALPSSISEDPSFRLVILANLPYVPDGHTINQSAMFEPNIAIFGGKDGLDYYRQLFEQIITKGVGAPVIFTESLPFQHDLLVNIANSFGYELKDSEDFIQIFQLAK